MDELTSAIQWHSPVAAHPYTKEGLTFAQGRHILTQTYSELARSTGYPQDIRAKLSDFAKGLETDLEDSAKQRGFFNEYSGTLKNCEPTF